jgi:hypothetical protein
MSNKTCLSCNKIFKYPYLLKRHQNGAYECIPLLNNTKTIINSKKLILDNKIIIKQDINIINENITIDCNTKNKNKYKCNNCNNIFKHRQSLHKHKKTCNISQNILKVQEDTKEKTKIKKTEIEKLQIQIKLQEKELQALRHKNLLLTTHTKNINLDNKNKIASNFIYLIREREFNENNKEIYKIGKTTQTKLKRINAYPNDSILYLYKECSDCHLSEKEIIKLFKIKYIHKNQIGNEYFEGNREDMMDDICNIIKFKKETIEIIL